MKTIAELKRMKTFKAKRIALGKYTIENHAELVNDFINEVKKKIGEENYDPELLKNSPTMVTYNQYTFLKPRYAREVVGTVHMRSKDYYFSHIDPNGEKLDSYGEIRANELTPKGWNIGPFTYEIIEN